MKVLLPLSLSVLRLPGGRGHGLTAYVMKCDGTVTASCCDLSSAPASEEVGYKEPDFGRSILPNQAFVAGGRHRQGAVFVADLGVAHRASVWDATNPECADGEGDESPPSPCWREEPDASDYPAFTPHRCAGGEGFNVLSINVIQPLMMFESGSAGFRPTPNGERMKIYGQDWPVPTVLAEGWNALGTTKWAAVLGASAVTPRTLEEGPVEGTSVPKQQIAWTAGGVAKDSTEPYTFESTFARDLSWGATEYWSDKGAGVEQWGDQEHYLYQLVDGDGGPCRSPVTQGQDLPADKCADGVYLLKIALSVDGVDSAPVDVLFARGVDMTGPAMQAAYKYLHEQNREEGAAAREDGASADVVAAAETAARDAARDAVKDAAQDAVVEAKKAAREQVQNRMDWLEMSATMASANAGSLSAIEDDDSTIYAIALAGLIIASLALLVEIYGVVARSNSNKPAGGADHPNSNDSSAGSTADISSLN